MEATAYPATTVSAAVAVVDAQSGVSWPAVAAGAVATAGAAAGIAGGRSTYFGASTAGTTSLICVVVMVCGAAVAVDSDSDRLRSPA